MALLDVLLELVHKNKYDLKDLTYSYNFAINTLLLSKILKKLV